MNATHNNLNDEERLKVAGRKKSNDDEEEEFDKLLLERLIARKW